VRRKLQQYFKKLAMTVQRHWRRISIFFAITSCLAVIGIVAGITNGPQWSIVLTVLPMIINVAVLLFPTSSQEASTETPKNQDRERLLESVREDWVTDAFKGSFYKLYNIASIILELRIEQDFIPGHSPRLPAFGQLSINPIQPGDRITQLYKADTHYRKLLIVGEPGSGKTTLLLELVEFLLDCAKQDNDEPMPVVFTLSEWTKNRLPLREWFINELSAKNGVPPRIGKEWIEQGQIIPLLDGLDEVGSDALQECIEEINIYMRKFSQSRIVVTCRYEEYKKYKDRSGPNDLLAIRRAVLIQPLSRQQVDNYLKDLSRVGCQLETLREALDQHVDLRELTETPLDLSILAEAYEGKSVQDLIACSAAERQQRVYEKYVDRMLTHRGPSDPNYQLVFSGTNPRRAVSPKQQTIAWLSWLAAEMENHKQTVVYIERLQPSWLPEDLPHRGFHHGLTFRLVREMAYEVFFYGVVSGLIGRLFALILHILFGVATVIFDGGIVTDVLNLLIVAGISGLVSLLYSLGLNILSTGEIHPMEVTMWKWKNMGQHLMKSVRAGMVALPLIGTYMGVCLIIGLITTWLKIDLLSWGYFGLIILFILVMFIICLIFQSLGSVANRSLNAIDAIFPDNKLSMIYGLLGGGLGLLIGMGERSLGVLGGGVIFGMVGAFFGWMLNGLTSGLDS